MTLLLVVITQREMVKRPVSTSISLQDVLLCVCISNTVASGHLVICKNLNESEQPNPKTYRLFLISSLHIFLICILKLHSWYKRLLYKGLDLNNMEKSWTFQFCIKPVLPIPCTFAYNDVKIDSMCTQGKRFVVWVDSKNQKSSQHGSWRRRSWMAGTVCFVVSSGQSVHAQWGPYGLLDVCREQYTGYAVYWKPLGFRNCRI